MIKTLKILGWVYIGLTVFVFVTFILLSKIGASNLSESFRQIYYGICTFDFCSAGKALTGSQIGIIFFNSVLPVFSIYGVLLYALYTHSWTTYRFSLAIFLFILLSEILQFRFSIPAILFPSLMFTKPVRVYFQKPSDYKFSFKKMFWWI